MGEERSSEGVYGPGITKETKSEATMVLTVETERPEPHVKLPDSYICT